MPTGSDRGLVRPMLDGLRQRYGRRPKRHLVDGGFCKNEDTEWAAGNGVRIYGPPGQTRHKTDPYAPRADDGPGVAAWRRRMKSPHGKGVYKRRAMGECINKSEEHTSELQSLMRISYAVFCLKNKNTKSNTETIRYK